MLLLLMSLLQSASLTCIPSLSNSDSHGVEIHFKQSTYLAVALPIITFAFVSASDSLKVLELSEGSIGS